MRLGDAPESENFEDRTGQSGGMGFGGGGGGILGLLLPLIASRFGFVGILVLVPVVHVFVQALAADAVWAVAQHE